MHSAVLIAALMVGAGIDDGSILVLHNSKKVVGVATGSSITHVAMVLNHNGKTYVYEATPAKVRRVPLKEYYQELGELNGSRSKPIRMECRTPSRRFSSDQKARLRSYLESQLGRRYSVRGYVRRSPGDGIHCAGLVGQALNEAGICRVVNPHGQSPDSLMTGIRTLYSRGALVAIPKPKVKLTWCERASVAWSGFRHWCAWSFVESFRFCF